jgi:hypothetical protein
MAPSWCGTGMAPRGARSCRPRRTSTPRSTRAPGRSRGPRRPTSGSPPTAARSPSTGPTCCTGPAAGGRRRFGFPARSKRPSRRPRRNCGCSATGQSRGGPASSRISPFSLVVTGDVVVVSVVLSPSLRTFSIGMDARTGRRLWQKAFPAAALTGTDGIVFCFTFNIGLNLSYSVQARHAQTGAIAWKRTFPGQPALAAARGVFYLGAETARCARSAPRPAGPYGRTGSPPPPRISRPVPERSTRSTGTGPSTESEPDEDAGARVTDSRSGAVTESAAGGLWQVNIDRGPPPTIVKFRSDVTCPATASSMCSLSLATETGNGSPTRRPTTGCRHGRLTSPVAGSSITPARSAPRRTPTGPPTGHSPDDSKSFGGTEACFHTTVATYQTPGRPGGTVYGCGL